MRQAFTLASVVLAAAMAVAAPAPKQTGPTEFERKAEGATWDFDAGMAQFYKSVEATDFRDRGKVEVIRLADTRRTYTFRLAGSEGAVQFVGHFGTPVAVRDDTLYYADFSATASGCAVVATDLKTGERKWRAELRGLGPMGGSKYCNEVNLTVDGGAVRVLGRESGGRYVEYVDGNTGRTVGHKVFTKN